MAVTGSNSFGYDFIPTLLFERFRRKTSGESVTNTYNRTTN